MADIFSVVPDVFGEFIANGGVRRDVSPRSDEMEFSVMPLEGSPRKKKVAERLNPSLESS